MIKTLTNLLKQDKEKFVVPKGVQDCIPITAIYDDGIFRVGKDKYSKSFKFTDINFAVASREDKEAMFLEYSELLNSLDSGATTKLTINNRRLNRLDFEKTILIPETGDELDVYREEYNKMLLDKATGANAIVQDKYVTISINKKSVEDARTYFARVGADLIAHFGRLGSKCVELETDERLRIFHDFYRVGEESSFHFDIKETRKKGHDFKDYICPDTMEFEKDYFKMGNRYGRVLFLREYASYIKDSMVAELTDMNRNLMMSIDIVPVPTDEAVKEAENRLLGVETNITNWQRRQNANNNFSATVPYDMEQQKKEMKEFLDDLTTRDQRMMFAVITMVITADSKEQLENDTEALLTTARKHLCQFATLRFQQVDGLNTVMPFGTRKIDAFRTLTTESLLRYYPYGRAFTAGGNQAIVEVALTQLGNQGGQPYWSWYGFDSRVEWCACFVSWCADQCGYIESGLVPKFAGCVDGANWFKSNGKWQSRTYEPKTGDIIFFDWEGDGTTDHVGIVEKCENGTVYTVEGNSGDACKQRQYTVGSSNIYGYGIPAY